MKSNLAFLSLLFFTMLVACNNKNTTSVGEIHTNDAYSNKIAELLKAYEAKDSVSYANMFADDFKLLDETKSGWVDNDYYKDTSKGFDKKLMIKADWDLLLELNSIKYENPSITSYYYANGDTITTVKAYFSAVSKNGSNKIHNPYYRVIKWKNGKISQMLKYTDKTANYVNSYDYSTNFNYADPNYGYGTPTKADSAKVADSTKVKY